MTNAERQARHHQRRQQRLSRSVTLDDVTRAVQLMWTWRRADPLNDETDTWEEWLARARTKRGRSLWSGMTPSSGDPADYAGYEPFTDADRALLARVGAMALAFEAPPAAEALVPPPPRA